LLQELQKVMEAHAGIVRTGAELEQGQLELRKLEERRRRVHVEGTRQFNPGWNQALDLRNLITVSEAITLAALQRTESRGAHSRIDFPKTDPEQEKFNLAISCDNRRMQCRKEPRVALPEELTRLIQAIPGELSADEVAPAVERRRGF
jgi:succinate dehydrogenase / fumarate reductase flavoprotein subunit